MAKANYGILYYPPDKSGGNSKNTFQKTYFHFPHKFSKNHKKNINLKNTKFWLKPIMEFYIILQINLEAIQKIHFKKHIFIFPINFLRNKKNKYFFSIFENIEEYQFEKYKISAKANYGILYYPPDKSGGNSKNIFQKTYFHFPHKFSKNQIFISVFLITKFNYFLKTHSKNIGIASAQVSGLCFPPLIS